MIILNQDITQELFILKNKDYYSIRIEPVKFSYYESGNYLKRLTKIDSFWSKISLHQFPLSIQSIFYTILLIPFGTVILSLARNLIGVNTFGIFTPVLLTLFFIETSLLSGIVFLFIVVLSGFLLRYLLDKFHLLAVPRISILLTFVILIYIGFAILSFQLGNILRADKALNYFPIVIITVFIERFSIYYIEEGLWNTIKTLMGTLLVSITSFLIFSISLFKVILFNHPELLFVAIGINILIGSYTGFRLLELVRFRPLLKGD